MRRRPASLSTQLVLTLAGFALAVLGAVGWYLGRLATGELRDAQQTALGAAAQAAADLLATELRDREREIELLSQSPLLSDRPLDAPVVRETLQRRQALHEELAWLGIASPSGTVLQSTGGLLLGVSVAQREWFMGARERVYVGDVHEAKLLARLLPEQPNGEPTRFVDFAAPIMDAQGNLRGIIGAHAHWRWITGIVEGTLKQRRGAGLDALIVDREGRVLYPEALKRATDGVPLLPAGKLTSPMRWSDGEEYMAAEARVQARTRVDLGWRVIVRQPQVEALRPVRLLRNHLLMLGLAVAVLALLAAWALARRLSRPVERLARFAQCVETAREIPEVQGASGAREIAQLGDAVRSMAGSLLDAERRLQAANSSLEQQVQARTAELQAANEALALLATQDGLTGLANRRSLDQRLAEAQALYQRYASQGGRPHALLLIDLDHFKLINDRHGHPVGDEVLRRVAALLRQSVRATDLVARFGGEEFAVLLPGCAGADEALAVAEKMRAAIAAADFAVAGRQTASLGVSLASSADVSPAELLQRADEALYEAKRAGRNRVVLRSA
ncbi:MAG: GGDEF domain-containing protein [Roseateles sp.]|nr:MAG: GGDEF domain-containing protein [Roseateles sp.]